MPFVRREIAVWSDYDCDGIPGGVLMHDFLTKVGANFENYIPHRHDEGCGMNSDGIEKLAKEGGVKLIVTVDSGITDVGPVARANELGMDVIVTDHHLPGEKLPDAFAILNPNDALMKRIPSVDSAARASRGSSSVRHWLLRRNCGRKCRRDGRNGFLIWSGSPPSPTWSRS